MTKKGIWIERVGRFAFWAITAIASLLILFALISLILFHASCTPAPEPIPTPNPNPRNIETRTESFNAGLGGWWVDGKRAKAAGGQLVLDSGLDGRSAWAHTIPFQADSLISFTVRVRKTTDDFCLGIAPSAAIDHVSENGFFALSTRLRYYVAEDGNVRKLFRHYKVNGVISGGYFDEIFAVSAPSAVREPCELRIVFDGRGGLKYLYRDSVSVWGAWTTVGSDTLPRAMRGEVSFEASAYSTPFKGVARIDFAEVSYYAARQETLSVRVQWEANSEPDVAGYRVSRIGGETQTTNALEYRTQARVGDGFFVRAVDTAGNVSAPSETVYVRKQ